MDEIRPVDLARVFLDAFEAEARARTGSPYGWVSAPEDPALMAGVEAVRGAIAERHKAQWSELVDQAPAARRVTFRDPAVAIVHGQPFDVSSTVQEVLVDRIENSGLMPHVGAKVAVHVGPFRLACVIESVNPLSVAPDPEPNVGPWIILSDPTSASLRARVEALAKLGQAAHRASDEWRPALVRDEAGE